jgi:hypothetical protein
MKTQRKRNLLARAWQRVIGRRPPAHDPLLSLSITLFNFSTGWDRVLQKQRQFGA